MSINRYNFICTELPSFSQLPKGEDFLFSLSISRPEEILAIDLVQLHHIEFYTLANISFSLYFNANFKDWPSDKNQQQQVLDKLIQLFFHPNFEKNLNTPVIFADAEMSASNQVFFNQLNTYCKAQAFEECINLSVCSEKAQLTATSCLKLELNKPAELHLYYLKYIQELYYNNYLCLINTAVQDWPLYLSALSNIETEFQTESPAIFQLILSFMQASKQKNQLNWENKLLQEDLNNQKTYLSIIKSKDESLKILKFYENEYEILPLWYKRLGHVLKVIMGKRSFRSLFDNNVKKYKT